MARKWSGRLLVAGGLALALGCRSHPGVPVCTTPLLPDLPVPGPPRAAGPVEASPAPPLAKTDPGKAILTERTEPAPVVAPADVQTATAPPPPEVKPHRADAPPRGPGDGEFGPGPRMPDRTPEPVVVPVTARKPAPVPTPLESGHRIGHGPAYRWVVGIADRHSRGGYWTVRFADPGDDDPWGGKVRLLDDSRLAALSNGDLVYVRGEILAPASAAESAPAYPPYRVTEVAVVEKSR